MTIIRSRRALARAVKTPACTPANSGPGRNSLINGFHSRGPVGDFEDLLVMTGDPREKVYKEYVFGRDHAGALLKTGQWEGDALVYRAPNS